ncbi:MAG: ATP-binding protein [Candidatus Aminicenantes bacterium]|nr:ATP-binding protein [Candidatus Aminicenantes bacterium]
MFKRIYDNLGKFMKEGKALIIYGPRQVGKTTLLKNFLEQCPYRYKLDSGDNIRTQDVLSSRDFSRILDYISGYELVAIDEAQWIPHIGMALKIIVDQSPATRIVATGSSSFDLSQQVGEPLTGRKKNLILYPLSHKELIHHFNKHELKEKLGEFLVFGSYPEVLTAKNRDEKIEILNELVDSYLLKDILALERIKSHRALLQLLKLLAFQVGGEVSLNEIATQVKLDVKTVDRYIDLLEKSFVLKRLGGFSRNLRKEVTTKCKYYFLDNGVRNAVISQFNGLENRADVGGLFENFVITERIKKNVYEGFYGSCYFWRTYDGQEVDWVEEAEGVLEGYEFKFSQRKKPGAPKDWKKSYEGAGYRVINSGNYLDFIL